MHKLLATLVLSLFISTTYAQSETDTTKIAFIAYWSVGDSYDFKVTKVKKNWKNKKQTKNDSSQYVANFKVIDSTPDFYKVQWSYTNELVSSLNEKVDEHYGGEQALDSILNEYEVMNIVYKTDEFGEFLGIENWQEISDLMSGLFAQVKKSLRNKNPENYKKVEQVLDPIIDIYSSKEGIEQLVTKELQYFHFPLGAEFDVDKPVKFEQEFPNMLGGKPITGNAVLTIDSVDFENYFCILKEEVIVNPEETKAVVNKFMKKMGVSGKKAKNMIKDAKLDIRDSNIYEYYYEPGVPHKISAIRKTLVNIGTNLTETETLMTIELIYEDEE